MTPSVAQERSMAWQAICAGSNGIFFFAFWDTLRDPDVPFATEWLRLSAIAAEIDRFAPVLLSDAGPPTMVTYRPNTRLGSTLLAPAGPPTMLTQSLSTLLQRINDKRSGTIIAHRVPTQSDDSVL